MSRLVRTAGLFVFVLCAGALSGCGGVLYTINVLNASSALEEARLANAETLSPYEYYFARAHLEKAREEGGDAEYQQAIDLADTARDYAYQARDRARRAGDAHNAAPTSGNQAEANREPAR